MISIVPCVISLKYTRPMMRLVYFMSLLKYGGTVYAQGARSIVDYYHLLSSDIVCDFDLRYQRIVDNTNGYLGFISADDHQETAFQMALFKDTSERDLIVIHTHGYVCADIFDCARTEERKTLFVRYEDDTWADVQSLVLPDIDIDLFYNDTTLASIVKRYASYAIAYDLPRYGLSVRLHLEICDDYVNFDDPLHPVVSDDLIARLLQERKDMWLTWDRDMGLFRFRH